MGRQLELMGENGETHKINVQDVKMTYPVNGLIKHLPDDKALGCVAKYDARSKHLVDLH